MHALAQTEHCGTFWRSFVTLDFMLLFQGFGALGNLLGQPQQLHNPSAVRTAGQQPVSLAAVNGASQPLGNVAAPIMQVPHGSKKH
jgi:hypothetical protein